MTDRKKIISWLKEDLEYYKNNIGEVKDYGYTKRGFAKSTTIITEELIDTITVRIMELEVLESKSELSEVNRKEIQKV